ncbi:S-layer homology domain-containing protein [Paenibacillus chungangensis]|uniref:S-layer homology domain-containing protein n=1 Tax=Paenibacillus chungangensis TaxID=696535 RepID=A0ABW3HR41_9BACL
MKLRISATMIALLLLIMTVPTAVWAESGQVVLHDIGDKHRGEAVRITGTSSFDEVIVKVIGPNHAVLLYDMDTVEEQGEFLVAFTLPADAPLGDYHVVAGNGSDVAATSFSVVTESDGGGWVPPIAGGGQDGEDTDHLLDERDYIVMSNVTAEGQSKVKLSLDSAKLVNALEALAERNERMPLHLQIKEDASVTELELDVGALLAADRGLWSGAHLSIQWNNGGYELPLQLIADAFPDGRPGAGADDAKVTLVISQMDEPFLKELADKVHAEGGRLLSGAVEFKLFAELAGRRTELRHFGLPSSSFAMDSEADGVSWTAVAYDSETGQLRFVPSIFDWKGESAIVTMRHHADGVYAIAVFDKTFADLQDHWAREEVEALASKLVVNGVSDKRFAPDDQVTRAQFTALLVRSLGIADQSGRMAFTDVDSSDWYIGEVGAAVSAGLVTGFDDGTFRPDDIVTREQAAAMLSRALQLIERTASQTDPSSSLERFRDRNEISEWAEAGIARLVENGILTGVTPDMFNPGDSASRAQSVVMLYRMLMFTEYIHVPDGGGR